MLFEFIEFVGFIGFETVNGAGYTVHGLDAYETGKHRIAYRCVWLDDQDRQNVSQSNMNLVETAVWKFRISSRLFEIKLCT